MRRVGRRRTPCERVVGTILARIGKRYRFNNGHLPGTPDLSNQRWGWAIFVNGCFWHGHKNCAKTKARAAPRVPRRHRSFWASKIEANRNRDARKCWELRSIGIKVIIVWECQLRKAKQVQERLSRALPGQVGEAKRGNVVIASQEGKRPA
jgi:DNA mismatch endonuclease (patch repair protein)